MKGAKSLSEEEKIDAGLTKEREKFIKDVINFFAEYDIDEESKCFATEILTDYFNKYKYKDLLKFGGRVKKLKKIIKRALK